MDPNPDNTATASAPIRILPGEGGDSLVGGKVCLPYDGSTFHEGEVLSFEPGRAEDAGQYLVEVLGGSR
jgi:hypothetical protein